MAVEINEELRKSYWKTVSRTRHSGRISQSVIEKTEASWERFAPDVVEEALRIHRDRYAGYKETIRSASCATFSGTRTQADRSDSVRRRQHGAGST